MGCQRKGKKDAHDETANFEVGSMFHSKGS